MNQSSALLVDITKIVSACMKLYFSTLPTMVKGKAVNIMYFSSYHHSVVSSTESQYMPVNIFRNIFISAIFLWVTDCLHYSKTKPC